MHDLDNIQNNIRENILLAMDCQFTMPQIIFTGNISPEKLQDLLESKQWDLEEPALINKPSENDISYLLYFNGEKFTNSYIIINDPHLLTGKQGPELTANCVTAFQGKLKLETQEKLLARQLQDSEYQGWITIDLVIANNKLYYSRIYLNTLIDYAVAVSSIYDIPINKLNDFVNTETLETDLYGASIKVYASPSMNVKPLTEQYMIDFNIEEGQEGYMYSVSGEDSPEKIWKKLYKTIPRTLNDMGYCYRIDGDYKSKKIFYILNKYKYIS